MGRKIQTDLAQELCRQLGQYNEDGLTLEDVRNVENLLDIQIKIICAENFNTVIYKRAEKDIIIHLYKQGNHFDFINSMAAFFGSSYFCNQCNKPLSTDRKKTHVCKKAKKAKKACLLYMKEAHDPLTKNKLYCKGYNRYCYNQECFDEHEFGVRYVTYKCKICN